MSACVSASATGFHSSVNSRSILWVRSQSLRELLLTAELCVQSAASYQLLMIAQLHQGAGVKDRNLVSLANSRQEMRDYDRCTILHQPVKGILNDALAL